MERLQPKPGSGIRAGKDQRRRNGWLAL